MVLLSLIGVDLHTVCFIKPEQRLARGSCLRKSVPAFPPWLPIWLFYAQGSMVQFVCVWITRSCMYVWAKRLSSEQLSRLPQAIQEMLFRWSPQMWQCVSVSRGVCMCIWTATTAPSPVPAGLPMKGLDVWGEEDRGGHKLLPAPSFKLDQKSSEFFRGPSCCYLCRLWLSITLRLSTPPPTPSSRLYLHFQPFCNLSVFLLLPTPPRISSHPPIQSFFSANILSCSRWAGQIQLEPWQPSKPCIAGMVWMRSDGSSGWACVLFHSQLAVLL